MFQFSLRDWLWFCIVMALAIGWGSHVRYTFYAPQLHPIEVTPDSQKALEAGELVIKKYRTERDEHAHQAFVLLDKIRRMNLTADQKQELEAAVMKMHAAYPFEQ